FGTDSFTWDSVAPSSDFTIDSGALYTTATSVRLHLVDGTGVHVFRYANGTDCSSAIWESYVGLELTDEYELTVGEGLKTICVHVTDVVRNERTSSTQTITSYYTERESMMVIYDILSTGITAGANAAISGRESVVLIDMSTVTVTIKDDNNDKNRLNFD